MLRVHASSAKGNGPGASERQLRSLHVSDQTDSGGAEAVFRDTVDAAGKLGHVVRTVVSDGNRTALSYLMSARWYSSIRRTLKEFDPDIVHVQNYYRFLSPSILLALALHRRTHPTMRVVFTAHDYHLVCPNSGFQHFPRGVRTTLNIDNPRVPVWASYDQRSRARAFLKSLQHLMAYRILRLDRTFDLIIAPSEFLKNIFEKCGVEAPIALVRNPVEFPAIRNVASSKSGDLVYMGRVAPEKGLREFILALEGEGKRVSIDVYGAGVDWKALDILATGLNHVSLVMRGPVARADVPGVLSKYRALIYPSIWPENAPIVVVEAIVNGLPVVVPTDSGALEMGNLGEFVSSFTIGSRHEISEAVRRALDVSARNHLVNPQDFARDSYVSALRDIYKHLLHGPSKATRRSRKGSPS